MRVRVVGGPGGGREFMNTPGVEKPGAASLQVDKRRTQENGEGQYRRASSKRRAASALCNEVAVAVLCRRHSQPIQAEPEKHVRHVDTKLT